MMVSKKFDGTTDLTERWYGTQYQVHPYPQDKIKVCLEYRCKAPESTPFKVYPV